jgi:hypothetical protein
LIDVIRVILFIIGIIFTALAVFSVFGILLLVFIGAPIIFAVAIMSA